MLKVYGTYIPNQKFDSSKISVLCDLTKIEIKSSILILSKKFILHNNNI